MKTIIGVRVKLCYQFKINFTLTQLFHEMKIGGLGLSLNYELAVLIDYSGSELFNS